VAAVLELTDGEAKVFWPVYNAYQSDIVSHYDRVLKLLDTYTKAYDTMTDVIATSLLKQFLALERDHVALLDLVRPALSEGAAASEGRAPVPDREQGPGPRELRARAKHPVRAIGGARAQSFGCILFLMTDSALSYWTRARASLGPSIVVLGCGYGAVAHDHDDPERRVRVQLHQKGRMAGLGLQGSKISRIDRSSSEGRRPESGAAPDRASRPRQRPGSARGCRMGS